MKRFPALVSAGGLWVAVLVHAAAPAPVSIRSHSGQFVVAGQPRAVLSLEETTRSSSNATIQLDPTLVSVSCERVKAALLRELQLPDRWKGQVFVRIHPQPAASRPVELTSVIYANGWEYHLELPEALDRDAFLRTLTSVALTELANREAGSHPAEQPLWLVEGFAARLAVRAGPDLILQPGSFGATGNPQWWVGKAASRDILIADQLRPVREALAARAPLSFDDLSQPRAELLTDESRPHFRHCAHLFLHELLQRDGAPRHLAEMLRILPGYFNWQTAFLKTFAGDFPRLLDVEKWWALNVAVFTRRDDAQAWSRDASLAKLDDMLATFAAVRTATNALPSRTEVSLQEIIRNWPLAQQQTALQDKLNQLRLLRLHTHASLVPLVDGYTRCLADYLDGRFSVAYTQPAKHREPAPFVWLIRRAIRQLDALDAQRLQLRQTPTASAAAPAGQAAR